MGSFTAYSEAETALTKEFNAHVFEITTELRVSHTYHNYRVCVVGPAGLEPATRPL
jgi:hypothetical protein